MDAQTVKNSFKIVSDSNAAKIYGTFIPIWKYDLRERHETYIQVCPTIPHASGQLDSNKLLQTPWFDAGVPKSSSSTVFV